MSASVFVDTGEVMQILGVSRQTVQRLLKVGELVKLRGPDGRNIFARNHVEELAKSRITRTPLEQSKRILPT